MHRAFYLAGWGWVLIASALVYRASRPDLYPPGEPVFSMPGAPPGADAAGWFTTVKPNCNALEVELRMASDPAPTGWDGDGFRAACFAIAGRIDRARAILDSVPAEDRERAAGIVFDVGHPIADAGDDRSAGPIMQLVADYQPWNYMALYHAGMSFYVTGEPALSRDHLRRFLELYGTNDGWRANTLEVLGRLDREGDR
ncbi:MAG: hypothetical protein PVH00_01325 [Gemmatimonadota bacterium]|jgi:hypothetical protein